MPKPGLSQAAASVLFGIAVCSTPALAADGASLWSGGKPILDARYRYELVDQTGLAAEADAHTLRARLGFQTGTVAGFKALAEFEGIVHLSDSFNDTVNGRTRFPVVTDPDGGELNRLQLDYTGFADTTLTLGRQRINLDNQRFVGGVGFRQNEQTFDALRVTTKAVKNLELTYALVGRTNRIFGNASSQGEFTGASHLLNASVGLAPVGKLTTYTYYLDLEEADVLSTRTVGARLTGKQTLGAPIGLVYALEYAQQVDVADNPLDLDLAYWTVEAGLTSGEFALTAGIESLEGDGRRGFSTPLATLHKFQGYADVFLTTPAAGIVDTYGKLGYETKMNWSGIAGLSAALWYHNFEDERGGAEFGSEVDAEVAVKLPAGFTVSLKYADFDGERSFADRRKLWLSVDYSY